MKAKFQKLFQNFKSLQKAAFGNKVGVKELSGLLLQTH